MNGLGLIVVLVAIILLIGIFWRFDPTVQEPDSEESATDGEEDRLLSQVAAAQRLRHEAEATPDLEEKARLLRFADEADGTAEKIRQGLLSDQ